MNYQQKNGLAYACAAYRRATSIADRTLPAPWNGFFLKKNVEPLFRKIHFMKPGILNSFSKVSILHNAKC